MSTEFRITTLVENTVPKGKGLIGEHGLSFYIEAGDRKILFDTGQGFALAKNAEAMGIDLSTVEVVVLSHGHYDHTGGLNALLSVNRRFKLYAHPEIFVEKFADRNGRVRPIGFAHTHKSLERMGIQVVLDENPMEIVPGITTTGEVPMKTPYETIDSALVVRQGETLAPDPLRDDLSLVLHTQKGRIILLGCAHRGVINILTHVQTLYGKTRLLALAGGLHLMGAAETRLKMIIESLEAFSPELLAAGHCTGYPAVLALWAAFKERFRLNQVGSVIEI